MRVRGNSLLNYWDFVPWEHDELLMYNGNFELWTHIPFLQLCWTEICRSRTSCCFLGLLGKDRHIPKNTTTVYSQVWSIANVSSEVVQKIRMCFKQEYIWITIWKLKMMLVGLEGKVMSGIEQLERYFEGKFNLSKFNNFLSTLMLLDNESVLAMPSSSCG